jgi:ubiquinone/menaquinone biosynthesis C-methylase UbiE
MSEYSKLAKIYDALYSFKNYEAEAKRLHEIIADKKTSPGNALLDVACGTGSHLSFLKKHYAVEGLDFTPEMLEVAHTRQPQELFHLGDMRTFDLGRRFDVVTCLFSSIGYLKSPAELREATVNMARHLLPGGVLIIEPWLTEETWKAGGVHALYVDKPEFKIARMDIPAANGRLSTFEWHMLIGTPQGIEYLTQKHELFLFSNAEYIEAFNAAGLDVIYDEKGLMNRGLFIGTSITLKPKRRFGLGGRANGS